MWASRGLQNWNNGLQSQNKQKKQVPKPQIFCGFGACF